MADMSSIAANEQKWKDDVADATGNPDGHKEGEKHSEQQSKAPIGMGIHQHVAGRRPGADQHVHGVGIFGFGKKVGNQDAQKGSGIDQPPLLDKSQM